MNDVEIIDLHARSCPATYAELLAKYSAVCKERDELKKREKHGHWKAKRWCGVGASIDDAGWIELEELCSVCGKWVKTQGRSPLCCSNCGAKMDKEDNNVV